MRQIAADRGEFGDYPSLELLELAGRDLADAEDDLAAAQRATLDVIADATTGRHGRACTPDAAGQRAIAQAKQAEADALAVYDDCKAYQNQLRREMDPGYIPDEWR